MSAPPRLGTTFAVRDVRAVTPHGVVEDATIVVTDGVVESVAAGGAAPPAALGGRGLLALPGLVDTHSDGLEKELQPRRHVHFPVEFALRSFEGRLRSAGVTTVHHGVAFEDEPRTGRSVALAREVCDAIVERRRSGHAPVDHRFLFRVEARSPGGVEALAAHLEILERTEEAPPGPPLVSFEDHTPGQGQYRDVEQFKKALSPDAVPEGTTVDEMVDEIIAEATENRHLRDENLAVLSKLAADGRILLLSHDAEDAAGIDAACDAGATVAEFPLTMEAASAAQDRGMRVVAGAPNAVRGRSHAGNVAAAELVAAGVCDVLASDYLPPSMLAAAFLLARQGVCDLPRALSLVTAGPADAAGITGRGRLEPGAVGDLVLVDDRGSWPQVVGVSAAGDPDELRILP